jgi:apolipoprotein N-acyltransferase
MDSAARVPDSAPAQRQGRIRRVIGAFRRAWRRGGPEFSAWRGQSHLFLLAAASALVMRLAYPRWNLYPIAAVGLVPFLWAISRATSGKQAFYVGWVFGAVFYYVLVIWLNILVVYSGLIPPAILALGLYLGLFKGLFAWMAWKARRNAWTGFWVVAAAWVAIEFLQSVGDLGFPWGYLGHSLWRHPSLIQIAAWTGVYGLSLILFWINHFICDGLGRLRREPDASPVAQLLVRAGVLPLFGAAMFLAAQSAARHTQAPDFYTTPPVMVGIVQPNIAQKEKFRSYEWDTPEVERRELQDKILSKTIRMTYELQRIAADQRCDLILWPETAVTDDLFSTVHFNCYETLFRDLPTSFGAPVFFGADNTVVFRNGRVVPPGQLDLADYRRRPEAYTFEAYNSAYLAEPGRGLNPRVYRKTFLVPFAEGIPYVQRLQLLVDLIGGMVGIQPFSRGTEHTVYDVRARDDGAPVRFGPLICYESCYPDLSRALVRAGAEMIVIITNDAWYEQTAGPAQHELEAIFRAVETRRWIARCANTGISCFVSPTGQIEEETLLARDATIRRPVRGVKELTFYTRWGDLFAWLAVAVAAAFIAAQAVARSRSE